LGVEDKDEQMKELGKDVINLRAKAILEKNLEELAEGPESVACRDANPRVIPSASSSL